MINSDVLLISATNEETPYEQLLHLLFSSNIENQTVKKKQALKILRQKYLFSLKTKTFKPKDNWQLIRSFFENLESKLNCTTVSCFMLLVLRAMNYI